MRLIFLHCFILDNWNVWKLYRVVIMPVIMVLQKYTDYEILKTEKIEFV